MVKNHLFAMYFHYTSTPDTTQLFVDNIFDPTNTKKMVRFENHDFSYDCPRPKVEGKACGTVSNATNSDQRTPPILFAVMEMGPQHI